MDFRNEIDKNFSSKIESFWARQHHREEIIVTVPFERYGLIYPHEIKRTFHKSARSLGSWTSERLYTHDGRYPPSMTVT